jgi:hypothetical protein
MNNEDITDKERLAVVEAQVRWQTPIIERIEAKVDKLMTSHLLLAGKLLGAAAVVSLLVTLGVEYLARK